MPVAKFQAGLLLGPSGLGRWKKFSDTVFPQSSFDVLSVGTAIGITYYFFIIGVKQDPKVILNTGRMALVIAIVGAIIPLITISSFLLVAMVITKIPVKINFSIYLASSLSLTFFPNLIPVLSELKLLNSKLGRLAISISTNHNALGWAVSFIMGLMRLSSNPNKVQIYTYVLFIIALPIVTFCIIRPKMFLIIRHAPQGKPVDNGCIIAILLGVLVIGLLSEFSGGSAWVGAVIFGLAMPEGPPLGVALVKKSEIIVQLFFLPLVYATIGLKTNVFAIHSWKPWGHLQLLIFVGYVAKLLGTVLPSRYFKLPFYDALSLALVLTFKELPELVSFMRMNQYEVTRTLLLSFFNNNNIISQFFFPPKMSD